MTFKIANSVKIGAFLTLLSTFFIGTGLWIFKEEGNLLPQFAQEHKGTIFGTQSDLPSNWPEDIPIPNYYQLIQATENQSQNQQRIHLILETEKPVEEVLNFYNKELEKNRWKGVKTFQPSGGEAWIYQKGGRDLELIVVRDLKEDKTLTFLKTTL
ncbi:MAG: hypothetical protein U9M98_02400 [Patescibacteria group bacterium]|nr:hypothetical protein [Patescibacteria group bacterium]